MKVWSSLFFCVVLRGNVWSFYVCVFLESWIERCLNESESKRYSSHTSLGNMSNDERKQDKHCTLKLLTLTYCVVSSSKDTCSSHSRVSCNIYWATIRAVLVLFKILMYYMLQMKKRKITEPLNHIQHQLLWNGKLLRTNLTVFVFIHM